MTGERLLQEKRTGGGEPAAAIGAAWWGVFPQWGTDLVTGGQGATDGTVWWSHFYRFPRITKSSGLQQLLSICSPSCTWSFSWLHVLIQPNVQSPLQVSNPLAFLCCKTREPDDWDRKCPLWLTLSSTHTHTPDLSFYHMAQLQKPGFASHTEHTARQRGTLLWLRLSVWSTWTGLNASGFESEIHHFSPEVFWVQNRQATYESKDGISHQSPL